MGGSSEPKVNDPSGEPPPASYALGEAMPPTELRRRRPAAPLGDLPSVEPPNDARRRRPLGDLPSDRSASSRSISSSSELLFGQRAATALARAATAPARAATALATALATAPNT